MADILLSGGTLIDGTGANQRDADVAIRDGLIVAVGDLSGVEATWTIECSGLIVCPGFIDLHNHSDTPVTKRATRAATNYVTQGCTTMVTGNCGSGSVDVGDYYDRIDKYGAGTNVAHLLPQGSLRKRVLGSHNVEPNDDQQQEMLNLTRDAMHDGAWGMSTGLIYVPSSYASTEELIAIAKIVGEHGGIYASHIRGEGTTVLKSVDEALQIGREAGLPVHVSHFKSSGRDAWGLVREAARMIAAARTTGQAVTADQYPYIASSTSLGATLLPSSARSGGQDEVAKRFDDEETGSQFRDMLTHAIAKKDDGEAVRIARYKPQPSWVGLSLKAIANREQTTTLDIAEQILRNGDAQIVNFSMNEDDVRHIMSLNWVATASDGGAKIPDATRPHPRNYGTFPRKLAYYSLQEEVIPLEAAVRSMTSLPAEILGMRDRGIIAASKVADITVFDPQTLKDTATFDDPHQYAEGIQHVFVNGVPALRNGRVTGALAGKALRKQQTDDGE